jgi:hypothetical protein
LRYLESSLIRGKGNRFWLRANAAISQWSSRSNCSNALAVALPGRKSPSMLPGFRFLIAAIVFSCSVIVFGLGAAALFRAAHEQFASSSSWRGAPEADFTAFLPQAEAPRPVIAMLRIEPSMLQSESASSEMQPDATADSQVSDTQVPDTQVSNIQVPNTQVSNTQVSNTRVSNTRVSDSQVSNSQVSGSQVSNTQVSNTQVSGSEVSGTQVTNTQVSDSQVSNSQVSHTQMSEAPAETCLPAPAAPAEHDTRADVGPARLAAAEMPANTERSEAPPEMPAARAHDVPQPASTLLPAAFARAPMTETAELLQQLASVGTVPAASNLPAATPPAQAFAAKPDPIAVKLASLGNLSMAGDPPAVVERHASLKTASIQLHRSFVKKRLARARLARQQRLAETRRVRQRQMAQRARAVRNAAHQQQQQLADPFAQQQGFGQQALGQQTAQTR